MEFKIGDAVRIGNGQVACVIVDRMLNVAFTRRLGNGQDEPATGNLYAVRNRYGETGWHEEAHLSLL